MRVEDCASSLRYPLWHAHGFTINQSAMDEKTRAAIRYAEDGVIADSKLGDIIHDDPVMECTGEVTLRSRQRKAS